MTKKFTRDDIGCYADSVFGHDHIRETLTDLLRETKQDDTVMQLIADLSGDMSDDAQEEEDDAIEIINDELCEDGVEFGLVDGDLVLLETDGWE